MFLSLLPLSCIGAHIRELVNILFPTDFLLISFVLNSLNMNMDIDTPRGRSFSLSENNLRKLLTHS